MAWSNDDWRRAREAWALARVSVANASRAVQSLTPEQRERVSTAGGARGTEATRAAVPVAQGDEDLPDNEAQAQVLVDYAAAWNTALRAADAQLARRLPETDYAALQNGGWRQAVIDMRFVPWDEVPTSSRARGRPARAPREQPPATTRRRRSKFPWPLALTFGLWLYSRRRR